MTGPWPGLEGGGKVLILGHPDTAGVIQTQLGVPEEPRTGSGPLGHIPV